MICSSLLSPTCRHHRAWVRGREGLEGSVVESGQSCGCPTMHLSAGRRRSHLCSQPGPLWLQWWPEGSVGAVSNRLAGSEKRRPFVVLGTGSGLGGGPMARPSPSWGSGPGCHGAACSCRCCAPTGLVSSASQRLLQEPREIRSPRKQPEPAGPPRANEAQGRQEAAVSGVVDLRGVLQVNRPPVTARGRPRPRNGVGQAGLASLWT